MIFNPDMQDQNSKIAREGAENGKNPLEITEAISKNNRREVGITLIGASTVGVSLPILLIGMAGLKKFK